MGGFFGWRKATRAWKNLKTQPGTEASSHKHKLIIKKEQSFFFFLFSRGLKKKKENEKTRRRFPSVVGGSKREGEPQPTLDRGGSGFSSLVFCQLGARCHFLRRSTLTVTRSPFSSTVAFGKNAIPLWSPIIAGRRTRGNNRTDAGLLQQITPAPNQK